MPVTRKLAAVVIADVVGYSRLMERDEAGTYSRLRELREELFDPKVAEHAGRIVRTSGDGLLVEFPSTTAALRCAVEVQREMGMRNFDHAPEDKIELRVGINLGDIIVDGEDIAGDGVNVAARLETLAEPGGICVASAVWEQVHEDLGVEFIDAGEHQVKNISRPIHVYRVALRKGGGGKEPASETARQHNAPPMSVAVIPFAPASGGADDQRFAERMTQDITSGIERNMWSAMVVSHGLAAKYKDKPVDPRAAGRDLNVRYLVEGELRNHGDSVVITAQLVETASARQVWSVRLPASKSPEDEGNEVLAGQLANALRNALYDAERKHAPRLPVAGANVLQLVLQAEALLEQDPSPKAYLAARELCQKALRHDSTFVPALVGLAWAISRELYDGDGIDPDRLVKELDDVTSRALRLDRNHPYVWVRRSYALAFQGQWERAHEAIAEAKRIDPYNNITLGHQASMLILTGRPEEALPIVDRAIALDPRSPRVPFYLGFKAAAHLSLGQYDHAIAACEKALGLGDYSGRYLTLTAAYAQKGDMVRAAAAKAELLKRQPSISIARLKSSPRYKHPLYLQQSEVTRLAGLRKAGIPEQ
jgi:adenylate cyclase